MSNTPTPLPEPLRPPIDPSLPNQPITLASGPVTALYGKRQFTADVRFSLCWLPFPNVRFDIPVVPDGHHPGLGDITFVLTDGTRCDRGMITHFSHTADSHGDRSAVSGVVNHRLLQFGDSDACHVLFLLPNFESPYGSGLQYSDGSQRSARLTLTGGGWKITLDQLPDYKDRIESIKAVAGFAVTHAGRLERDDGRPMQASDARPILEALGWYVSFCSGRWTGPCMPAGIDASGDRVWQAWDYERMSPFRERWWWLDRLHREGFEEPFAGFLRLWQDPAWEQVVRPFTV